MSDVCKEFIAQRQQTKFCSPACNNKHYKAVKRNERVGIQALKTEAEIKNFKIEENKDNPLS